MWTGDVDFQCATACVTNGDIELDMFEKMHNIIFSFTTFHFEIDFQWASSTNWSREKTLPTVKLFISCPQVTPTVV